MYYPHFTEVETEAQSTHLLALGMPFPGWDLEPDFLGSNLGLLPTGCVLAQFPSSLCGSVSASLQWSNDTAQLRRLFTTLHELNVNYLKWSLAKRKPV